MSRMRCLRGLALAGILALFIAPDARADELIVDGDFSTVPNSGAIRRDDKGQDWYESRKDTKEGRKLLFLSKKGIGGNVTPKGMVKAHPELNTYLTQRFAEPLTGDFSVRFDIYVKQILPDDNRSAFFMVGSSRDKKNGPNSTGKERFVFLGFENAEQAGKINLFAREGNKTWENKTIVAANLDLAAWHTIEVVIYPEAKAYEALVVGKTQPVELDAFGKKPPKRLTHISFASWNDGAGTFYIDNVSAQEE